MRGPDARGSRDRQAFLQGPAALQPHHVFCINASMIFFGYMMELHNQITAKTDWTAFIFGCFAGIIPWIVIALYTLGANQAAETSVPNFVLSMSS